MADQKEDSRGPREALIPPISRPRLESRVPTLPPPVPPVAAQPEPMASGIDKLAGRKPQAAPAQPQHRRITRVSELIEHFERLKQEREAQGSGVSQPPAAPQFDRGTYEFMQKVHGTPGEKARLDWSDLRCVTKAPDPPSLVDTLTNGLPAAPPAAVPNGTPHSDELLSRKLWVLAGLPRVRKKKAEARAEVTDIKKSLDHWCISLNHPAKEVLLDSLIEDTVSEFSALKRASKEGTGGLLAVCSGGRPPYLVESTVAAPVGTISDQFLEKLKTMRKNGLLSDLDAKELVEQLVRFVFHAPRPVEGRGITETEMRNGFFRAVAWCICSRTNPGLYQEFFSRNNILLIDAVGIAAGLNSDDARDTMGENGMRSSLYRLMKKRWVATGFEHMKEILRKDSKEGRLDPRAALHFTTALLKEVGEYQRIVQSYSVLARNLGNLSRGSSRSVLYMGEKRFMFYLLNRSNLRKMVNEGIDNMHKFIARLFSRGAKGSVYQEDYQYAVGRSPAEISDIFNTVLEGLDFLIGDPKMRRVALEAIQHYGIAEGGDQPASFKKLFALCLFTRSTDVQEYARLYTLLFDYVNPIVSDLALDYAAYLLARDVNFLPLHDEAPQESSPTLSAEDLAQILAEGDSFF